MLGSVNTESDNRFNEVTLYLRLVARISRTAGTLGSARELTAAKGLFFVHLYGAYEYTILAGLREVYRQINAASIQFKHCRPMLLSAALDPELTSLLRSGSKNAWGARRALFGKIGSSDIVAIKETVDPCSGRNVAVSQLQSIWNTLQIQDPIFPHPALKGRIDELVQNRVNVGHGNTSASEVGRRYTIEDLRKRKADVEALCTHILSAYEEYLKKQHFKI